MQIWGGVPAAAAQVDQAEALVLVVRQAARLHARSWRDPALLSLPWLKTSAWLRGDDRSGWERAVEGCKTRWHSVKTEVRFAVFRLAPQLRALIDAAFAGSSWAVFQAHVADRTTPWTLCHGDFHASNMHLYPAAAGPARLVVYDWSEVGPWEPMTDIAQLFISDVRLSSLAAGAGERAIEAYHAELCAQGVGDYPLAQCKADFARGVERWLFLFPLLASLGLPEALVDYFQAQIMAFAGEFPANAPPTFKSVVLV
eukprot:TRINITY_DN947_c0_g1_i2.p2 TRINITY_DN947_c0_g1~~TRINITY_DN947_c0_g1_i2.p2  ORF type:complete len:256 (-),score=57.72 TRINITY_DN947_c0_g1_i2:56-823(-)